MRKARRFWPLRRVLDEDAIGYARNTDGMYPLLTNDREMTFSGSDSRKGQDGRFWMDISYRGAK